jgi:predicted TIM-barrel fold metal-dependent hydrolase
MGMPTGIGIIDTMIGFPHHDMKETYAFITRQTKDRESKEDFAFPVEYMFNDVPETGLVDSSDPISVTLREMDLWGIEQGLIGVGEPDDVGELALKRHPDRFIPSMGVDPNEGMEGIRKMVRAYEMWGVRAAGVFPSGTFPQVAINDKRMYPIYAKCVELGIPLFCCAGVPGPRLKMSVQHVELIDEVMYDFPELVFVTRHGCEPWEELAVKLMLKWPGLHYSTSAFAPKYYPKAIVDYANTRGADKIIYAGYFPMGLSLERIMTEMPNVGFKDEVWPKFLRDNAARVLGLESSSERPRAGIPARSERDHGTGGTAT